MDTNFQKRTGYLGDIKFLLRKICKDYQIGEFSSYKEILIGYEDYNLILKTNRRDFFVKIFGTFRDQKECERYVYIMTKVINERVSHPKIYQNEQGFLYVIRLEKITVRLCVMEYIEGKSYFQLSITPQNKEMRYIIKQANLINKISLKPSFIYDSWAISNFIKEYTEKQTYLIKDDQILVKPYFDRFSSLTLTKLPHCFVHGDITKTNTLKAKSGKIYILDFAVANYYPRIQELAVLLCDLFFDQSKPEKFLETYNFVLKEYQKLIPLTHFEVEKLPLYLQFAHIMHLLRANYEKVVNNNESKENEYFLRIGRNGLVLTSRIWKN